MIRTNVFDTIYHTRIYWKASDSSMLGKTYPYLDTIDVALSVYFAIKQIMYFLYSIMNMVFFNHNRGFRARGQSTSQFLFWLFFPNENLNYSSYSEYLQIF